MEVTEVFKKFIFLCNFLLCAELAEYIRLLTQRSPLSHVWRNPFKHCGIGDPKCNGWNVRAEWCLHTHGLRFWIQVPQATNLLPMLRGDIL